MNLFNKRHLTAAETKVLGVLLDEAGPSEVVRSVGQWIACNHEDMVIGDKIRSLLNNVALILDNKRVL
jgi:hypothetical protein